MTSRYRIALLAGLASLVLFSVTLLTPQPAYAVHHAGEIAPNFRKTDLNGPSRMLDQYRGKVVVLFLLGYNCPFCLSNGPSFETNIWRHYQTRNPGQVQALGPDLYNGTSVNLTSFRSATGATFPLLLNGSLGVGDTNLTVAYGQFDNFVVINKQGVIRYNAFDRWPHGNRYHIDELQAVVDSLVTNTADIGDGPDAAMLALAAAPNPFRGTTTLELRNPGVEGAAGEVAVYDLAGREVATLHRGPVARGVTRLSWNGLARDGASLPPGVYAVRARIGNQVATRRVVLIP